MTGVYTFTDPTIDPAYCSITSNTLVNVYKDATLDPAAATVNLNSVDIYSSDNLEQIKFSFLTTIVGGFTHTSP